MKLDDKEEGIRDEVLCKAQKLFKRFGWAKTTMEDIAKAAGKGKSTLYYYYKSKEEIFDAVVTREMEEVFRITKEEVDKKQTAEEKLRAFSVTKFHILQHKENLCGVVRGDIQANIQHLLELNRRFELREITLVRSILRFGLENGEFGHFKTADTDAVAFAMVCAFRGVEIGLLVENKVIDFESRMDVIHDILMHGLKA
ncbi:TetR/AcrR family transcriptional regulator [Pontibacter sp. SGAir0037]|uniref:TetR/AcrR family transcriptional regulator n=1 Tax=Pontibacter sp. SGAir0037 TaxID=2571030 RepID=UPI0010CD0149|nr:TetR/AcrR family transcriptional regulator [Pontibacter sp. SGAir0037]QCR21589.1 hypothetical protein C1N53_03985 [Pontibacter sp. SGAir0037]